MLQLAPVSPTDDFIDLIKGLLNTILNDSKNTVQNFSKF